jgi:hypothetical protein
MIIVIFIKTSHSKTKASTSLKMCLKSLIIVQNVLHNWKEPQFRLNVFESLAIFKKASFSLEKHQLL